MKQICSSILVLILCLAVIPSPAPADEMPARYKKWLDEDVRWIITREERDAFLKLDSNALRDKFMEIFWDKRDPTPGTRDNEFKTEHYRRIEYANKFFGPRGVKNGWRSERGRMYIMFGPPKERQEFPNDALIYPLELWFYSGDERVSTASYFYIMFFQKGAAGDYQIYHPKLDGIQALSWKGNFDIDENEIMDGLQTLNAEVARAAISLNPMDPGNSLSSEVLLGQVDSWPERAVDGSWATDFLNSKGNVEVTYTFKQIVNLDGITMLFTPPDGRQQLHYALKINPEDLDIGQHEDQYYGAIEFTPSLADAAGNVIYERSVTTELKWNEEVYQEYRNKALLFDDVLPIIPGDYTFTLRVRNKVSRSFFLYVKSLSIPRPGADQFILTPPVLAYGYTKVEDTAVQVAPFRIFNIDYQPSSANEFTSGDTMMLFTELHFTPPSGTVAQVGEIHFTFDVYSDKGELVKQFTHIIPRERVNPYGVLYMSRQIPLDGLQLGKYRLDVTASEDLSKQSVTQKTGFTISDAGHIRRPTILALNRGERLNTATMYKSRGDELVKAGLTDAAMVEYGDALKIDPEDMECATRLAGLLLQVNKMDVAFTLLKSVEYKDPNNRQLVILLGQIAAAKGDYLQSAHYYQRLLFVNDKDIEILNVTGAMFDRAGDRENAKINWRKSLTLNPEQPEIRKLLDGITE